MSFDELPIEIISLIFDQIVIWDKTFLNGCRQVSLIGKLSPCGRCMFNQERCCHTNPWETNNLVQLRLVCKTWNDTIENKGFVSLEE